MSLYDGLDIDDKGNGTKETKVDVSGWGSSLKLLETQKQIQAKKASLVGAKQKKPNVASLTPVMNLGRKAPIQMGPGMRFNHQTGKLERLSILPVTSPFVASEAPSFPGVVDEYDPMHPNDYDEIVRKKREQRREERRKDLEDRESNTHRRRKDKDSDSDSENEFEKRRKRRAEEDEAEEEYEKPRMSRAGAAIAPPPSLLEEVRPPSPPAPANDGQVPNKVAGASFGLGGSVASKIMMRMGYREGQGLGKTEQGMSTALQVEKTSKRGGKIIHEKDIPKGDTVPPSSQEPVKPEVSNANLLKNPSKVILLLNMVGPGEVDADLEPETAEECQKYGKVVKCVIFEIPNTTEDQSVRIFVEFERMEAAIKAVVDLNGRYFGGRIVTAGFYNLDKFRRLYLVDPLE